MIERCPNCRARQQDGAICRRCGMDLAMLHRIEHAASQQRQRAIAALVAGEHGASRAALQRALALKTDPVTEQLARFLDWLGKQNAFD